MKVRFSPIGWGVSEWGESKAQPDWLGGVRMGQGEAQPCRLGGSEWVEVGLSPRGWGSQPHRLGGSEWVEVVLSPIG